MEENPIETIGSTEATAEETMIFASSSFFEKSNLVDACQAGLSPEVVVQLNSSNELHFRNFEPLGQVLFADVNHACIFKNVKEDD